MQQQDFVGDSFPLFWPNVGPEIMAALFGCELEWGEHTHWSVPIVHSIDDWHRLLEMKPDWDNPYWQVMEKMTDYALSICGGRFIVGLTDLHGNYDLLASLRNPEQLCTDLIDCPELILRAGRLASSVTVQAFERGYAKIAAAGMGASTWTPTYHEGPMYVPSCDFWCMVSPKMAREMILPEILHEMRPLQRSIFHLDGPQALPHLDLLLHEMPQLNAVQWVYGAGHGPCTKWLDVYRRCLRGEELAGHRRIPCRCDDDAETARPQGPLAGCVGALRQRC